MGEDARGKPHGGELRHQQQSLIVMVGLCFYSIQGAGQRGDNNDATPDDGFRCGGQRMNSRAALS
jgi:hypothetical protein